MEVKGCFWIIAKDFFFFNYKKERKALIFSLPSDYTVDILIYFLPDFAFYFTTKIALYSTYFFNLLFN